MSYWVVTRKTGLLHLASWLAKELPGQVRVTTLHERAEKQAWRGLLVKERVDVRRTPAELLADFTGTLVTDDRRWTAAAQAKGLRCFGTLAEPEGASQSEFAVGGWWDGGKLAAGHWLVVDWGLWPFGLGPRLVGGVSLVRSGGKLPDAVPAGVGEVLDRAGFRGYVAVDMRWDGEAGGWLPGAIRPGWGHFGGWPALALLHDCVKVEAVLGGEAPALGYAVTVAVPLSSPPYPFSAREAPEPAPLELDAATQAGLVFCDVAKGRRGLETAGVDGNLGLALGRGASAYSARQAVGAVARAVSAPQWRPDAGGLLDGFLLHLEQTGWL